MPKKGSSRKRRAEQKRGQLCHRMGAKEAAAARPSGYIEVVTGIRLQGDREAQPPHNITQTTYRMQRHRKTSVLKEENECPDVLKTYTYNLKLTLR